MTRKDFADENSDYLSSLRKKAFLRYRRGFRFENPPRKGKTFRAPREQQQSDFDGGVTLTELRVPSSVMASVKSGVVLDCLYTLRPNSVGLVVAWYFNNSARPVYQWIPGEKPLSMGVFRHRTNLDYKVSDHNETMHRALHIINPTIELSGDYRCVVSTYHDEDFMIKRMIVYFHLSTVNCYNNTNKTVRNTIATALLTVSSTASFSIGHRIRYPRTDLRRRCVRFEPNVFVDGSRESRATLTPSLLSCVPGISHSIFRSFEQFNFDTVRAPPPPPRANFEGLLYAMPRV
ncbi:Immunoglobulin subtype,Immunoglobulin-like domain,Immunoglobulin-like fold [Cinara cedri]|uniref:Immunoglobulin subtype,Immunoglobulin-like domain,Immunoglobulin-like fold n=1 Tax=Cinara cedri TaxID=506608 RepID=A0A5E4N1S4_9HEMI|nr:Immunoglobulin subtype,Immunoglobulin-like domain,Immunoglobulin-like fold [Cinara cedri]